jgi:CopA family copper-resistance protein
MFLRTTGVAGALAALGRLTPTYGQSTHAGHAVAEMPGMPIRRPGMLREVDLTIDHTMIDLGGTAAQAVTVNGGIPGPLLRFTEGDEALIRVHNKLKETTSIHWHGLILPESMDGVPGVSFNGIPAGETFTYRFPIVQSGTYWYHSHSGFQEQLGLLGPIVIDPVKPAPYEFDREYVVILSDWTFTDPHIVYARLKKQSNYYNYQQRTVPDFLSDAKQKGWKAALASRREWGRMRMDPTDISDITGTGYTYLINGLPPAANWTGLFNPGERVRLRFINAAAATYFDVRFPGLPMTVVQADGNDVQPVDVDEFRIAVAETYDVIVTPTEDRAYTLFAETMDRSGYAAGTLAPRQGMSAPLPERRQRSLRTMKDMGMDGMAGMAMSPGPIEQTNSTKTAAQSGMASMPGMTPAPQATDAMAAMPGMAMPPTPAGPIDLPPRSRLHEPGSGLENAGHRVLVYTDLRSLHPTFDPRPPDHEVVLHITGNMERYIWGFDGKTFSEAGAPIPFALGKRMRLTFVNDTMMDHPMHLHGMWSVPQNGAGRYRPRKHTINVKPAERLSLDIDADAPGFWAMHCHILYHMEAGMFRVVSVS